MEDWLKTCQISPLVKYRQNRNQIQGLFFTDFIDFTGLLVNVRVPAYTKFTLNPACYINRCWHWLKSDPKESRYIFVKESFSLYMLMYLYLITQSLLQASCYHINRYWYCLRSDLTPRWSWVREATLILLKVSYFFHMYLNSLILWWQCWHLYTSAIISDLGL